MNRCVVLFWRAGSFPRIYCCHDKYPLEESFIGRPAPDRRCVICLRPQRTPPLTGLKASPLLALCVCVCVCVWQRERAARPGLWTAAIYSDIDWINIFLLALKKSQLSWTLENTFTEQPDQGGLIGNDLPAGSLTLTITRGQLTLTTKNIWGAFFGPEKIFFKGAIYKNWPPVEFILQTNRGQCR